MQKKILFLDGLRGIAAFYVMIGHSRWLLWEGFSTGYSLHPQDYSVLDRWLMYFFSLFKWGHEFVLFFFVLSGFVIHIQYAKKLQQDPGSAFHFRRYFYKRIKRIYPPFLFAILLTTILDTIGRSLHFSIYSGTTPYELINTNVGNSNHSVQTFFGNILFLYKEYVPLFGTNGPTWSLKYEGWFYVLYPALLLLARKHIFYSTLLIIGLFVASFYPHFWPEPLLCSVFSCMICWWLGALLAEIAANRLKFKLLSVAMLCMAAFVVLFLLKVTAALYDLQIAFLFSAILAFLLWCNETNKNLRFLERLKSVGDFSYSLYIIHFPILVFLSGVILKFNGNKFPKHSFFIFVGIAICSVVAYLVHFIVERPFVTASGQKMGLQKPGSFRTVVYRPGSQKV